MQVPIDTGSIRQEGDQIIAVLDSLNSTMTKVVEGIKVQNEPEMMPYFVQLLDSIIWPAVVLIVLWAFKREFTGVFDRVKSFKASATGFELDTFEKELEKTKSLARSLALPPDPRTRISESPDPSLDSHTGISKSMEPPPDPKSGISKSAVSPADPVPADPRMRIVKIKLDLERKLREIADAGSISLKGNVGVIRLNDILLSNNLLTLEESKLVNGINKLTDLLMESDYVTSAQADEILDIYNKLP